MPDGRGGYGGEARSVIQRACLEAHQDLTNRGDCNRFVKAVVTKATAGRVTFPENANANEICNLIQKDPWTPLKIVGLNGTGLSKIAGVLAGHDGKLVVVGWRSNTGHGHVAIVLDLWTCRDSAGDEPKAIGVLRQDKAVIAAGQLEHPENSKVYMNINAKGGFGGTKVDKAVFGYIDVG